MTDLMIIELIIAIALVVVLILLAVLLVTKEEELKQAKKLDRERRVMLDVAELERNEARRNYSGLLARIHEYQENHFEELTRVITGKEKETEKYTFDWRTQPLSQGERNACT
jgi:Na+-transporting NADH:ubiquinone oxidoreductase subunit NqrC